MPYVPNPADPTQPTGNVDASTADDEFRALKAYVQGIALAAGTFSGVRQCAQDGAKDANGLPAFLTLPGGGGLALDLDASPNPLTVNFAGGQSAIGNNDRIGYLTNDIANVIAGLDASNTDYIYVDYVTQANWTWGKTLAPPQYGFTYDRTKQSVLQFGGVVGSTVFLDDFGNTWTAQGGAKVQTNQVKFGTGALGGGGAANVLNGAADYLKTVNITSLGNGGWAIRCWVQPTALPGAGVGNDIFSFSNAGGFGARLTIFNNAGTIKFAYALSTDGTSNGIANQVQGTTTPVVATWYFVELTFDILAGVYRLYVNGLQEQSTATTSKVCNLTNGCLGSLNGTATTFLTGYIDKPELLPYCQHGGGTAYVAPTAAPIITAAGYASDWMDIQAYKMYSVTAVSGAAGVNPTLTQKYRVYLGEADANGAATTAVRNYAYNGKYNILPYIYALSTPNIQNHNLGVVPQSVNLYLVNQTGEVGYSPGDEVVAIDTSVGAGNAGIAIANRKNTSIIVPSTSIALINLITGAMIAPTTANWRLKGYVSRGW